MSANPQPPKQPETTNHPQTADVNFIFDIKNGEKVLKILWKIHHIRHVRSVLLLIIWVLPCKLSRPFSNNCFSVIYSIVLCSIKRDAGVLLEEPVVVEMAKKYKKTPAQVIYISYMKMFTVERNCFHLEKSLVMFS